MALRTTARTTARAQLTAVALVSLALASCSSQHKAAPLGAPPRTDASGASSSRHSGRIGLDGSAHINASTHRKPSAQAARRLAAKSTGAVYGARAAGTSRSIHRTPPAPLVIPRNALKPRLRPSSGTTAASRPTTETGAFSILRRAASKDDRLPPLAALAVRRANAAHATGEVSVSVASARRALLPGALPSWVLGARGVTCLLRAEPLPGHSDYAYSMNCVRTSWAMRGYLVSVFANVAGYPGQTLIEGIVPDHVRTVSVILASGVHQTASVYDDAYALVSGAARSATFYLNAARHTVTLPQPPEIPLIGP
jgi:hypothetical protein